MKHIQISSRKNHIEAGFTLLEALITIVILAFGLLGLAGFQAKIQLSETESFQRAQALLLVEDMANRLSANRAYIKANPQAYVTATPLGTGNAAQPSACTGLTGVQLDQCEWNLELKGAAEKASGSANFIGAMVGARGCVENLGGSPPVYRVTVAWQGMSKLQSPSLACGQNSYGADSYRRAIASLVPIACLTC